MVSLYRKVLSEQFFIDKFRNVAYTLRRRRLLHELKTQKISPTTPSGGTGKSQAQ